MIEELQRKLDKFEAKAQLLEEEKGKVIEELGFVEHRLVVREKASEALKSAIDYFYAKSVKKLESLVTYGLQEVFSDRDLAVRAEMGERRGAINLDLITVDNENKVEGKARRSFGGAIVQVQAILVLIVVMILLNQKRFMILDEKFSNVSKDYQPGIGKVLSQICKEFGFFILLITHNPEILEHADRIYRAALKSNKLELTQER